MSESAPEHPRSSGGNILTRKLGPLPLWGWMGIGLVAAIAYYMVQKKNAAATPSTTAQTTTGTTNSSLIPQFVNQVYTNGAPPSAPNPRHKGGTTVTTTGGSPPIETSGQPPSNTIQSGAVTENVPDGNGYWVAATFPSQNAYQSFLSSLGATNVNGAQNWPPGYTQAQIYSAVTKVGGQVTSAAGQTGWSL